MARRQLKEMLKSDELRLGYFQFILDSNITEIIGDSGHDFVVIDLEHSSAGLNAAAACIVAADAVDMPAIVRVAEKNQAHMIEWALDAGAQGVLIPTVETRADAENAVRAALFAPEGERGWCPMTRAGRWGTDVPGFARNSNRDTFIAVLIESPDGIENLADILTVPGIDAVQLGPGDLSVRLGLQLGDEALNIIIDRAVADIVAAGKIAWLPGGSGGHAQKLGAKMLCHGADTSTLFSTLRGNVATAREDARQPR